ncbi:LruC domain-containing protein [Bacteroidaceae bacterium HV4-6-C5C]|nr:LruC domain-containing protein [Bacteroidaceae bacterium HV4-6-C5C]
MLNMKKINGLLVMVTLTGAMVFNGCSNDDVYDPNKVQTEPTKNPLGENFSAPNDFNWSMINTVKLNISVKDEFAGQYNYLIEVFTSNPLSNPSATPIAAGTAKTNYSAEIAIPKTIERLFIRQTDPKGRKEIYEFAVPENGGTLECKLYYDATATKAHATRAIGDTGNSGWEGITDPAYTEETPNTSSATPITTSGFPAGTYIISNTYSGELNAWYSNVTIYIQGTWKFSSNVSIGQANIIVLNGGKIISENNASFNLNTGSSLTVQSNGSVQLADFTINSNDKIRNFGFIHANTSTIQSSAEFYNAKGASFEIDNKLNLSSCQVYNHGTIEVTNEASGIISPNNSVNCLIANYSGATIKTNTFLGGAYVVNNGTIEVNDYVDASVGILYNNCTLIAKKTFEYKNVILDKGSITGEGPDVVTAEANADSWKPVPLIKMANNPSSYTLKNGSMIKATNLEISNSPNTIIGEGNNISGIQVDNIKMTAGNHTTLSGNLVVATPAIQYTNSGRWVTEDGVVSIENFNDSKYTIATCSGYYYSSNPGVAPYNPTIPAINDATKYTYAFEDNWPAYGDFDLNDLVVSLDNKSISSNGKTVSFNLTLEAVGASKQLGLGIRLMNLATTPSAVKINGNSVSLENDSKGPAFIIFDDAHRQFGYTDSKPFINTVKDGSSNPVKNYTVTIEFSSAISASAFNINNFDLFIISKVADTKGKRIEIHVAGYPPTDLGNASLFGQGNDNSSVTSGKYYLSTENLAWGIVIPTDFSWPLEYNRVSDVYTEFKPWVTSGGKNNGNWFNTNNGKVY